MKAKKKRVIPGFGLSMGVTITILSLVVLIPLAALVIYTSRMHLSDIIETITRPRVLASFNFPHFAYRINNKFDYGRHTCLGACKI